MKISEIQNEGKIGDIAKAGALALSTLLPNTGQASAPETSPIPVARNLSETITKTKEETALLKSAKHFGIKGDELAALMAQAYHETMGFKRLSEMGSEKYFKRYDTPRMRKRLGNTKPNDWKKFIGRGFFHTTGRYNYKKVQDTFGIPVLDNPELLETNLEYALKASIYFWVSRVRARVSDFSDSRQVTKAVNGGTHGLSERTKLFDIYKARLTNIYENINESIDERRPSHNISVSVNYDGYVSVNLNITNNNLPFKGIDSFSLYDRLSREEFKELRSKAKNITDNAEKQMVELSDAYMEMIKAILADTSSKLDKLEKDT